MAISTLDLANSAEVPAGHALVRVNSHRAWHKVRAIAPETPSYFSFWVSGQWIAVPEADLERVRAIKGVTKSTPTMEFHRHWKF